MPTRVVSTETVRGHTATLGRLGVDESVDHRRTSHTQVERLRAAIPL